MEIVVKPSLHKLSLSLPTCATEEIMCRHHTVYSLLELYLNTLNKVVVSSDENSVAMENFALSLANWSEDVIEEIRKAFEDGGSAQFVLSDGDVLLRHLSEEVIEAIESGKCNCGESVGDVLSGIKDIYLTKEGQLVIEPKDENYDSVVGETKFARQVYKELPAPGLSTIDSPETSTDKRWLGGLMSCEDYEDIQNLKKYMPFIDDDGLLDIGGEKFTLTKAEKKYTYTYQYNDIKVLGIQYNVYGDGSVVNASGIGKTPSAVTYTAMKQTLRDGEIYGQPVAVTEVIKTGQNNLNANLLWSASLSEGATINSNDGKISASGTAKGYSHKIGDVSVDVVIGNSHTVSCEPFAAYQEAAEATADTTKITLPSAPTSPVERTITLTGSATVTSCQLVMGTSVAALGTVAYDAKGKKIVITGSRNTTTSVKKATIVINTNLEMQDGTTKTIEIPVEQTAGVNEILCYYGMSATVPTTTDGGTSRSLTSNSITISPKSTLQDKVKVHWVAMPTGSGYSLTSCKDEDGDDILDLIVTDTTSISGYVLYYNKSAGNIQNTTNFKFTK